MDQEGIANLLRPFNAYSQFIANYDPAQTAWSYLRIFEANGLCIALLGVNSALVSGRHKETRNGKEVDIDDRYLIIGEPQIHTLLHRPDFLQADIRLAVMHHPFDWLIEFDRELVQDELKKTCDFILHGHEHRPKVTVETGTGGHCVIIPAGPSYDRREPEISRCANAYNYVHLDFELANKPGIVYLRRYEDRQGWIKDTSTTGDDTPGYFTLELPQSLGRPSAPAPAIATFISSSAAQEARYRQHIIDAFKDLSFKGLTIGVRPIILPLEKVYVHLRAVAEVPEAADEFSPEERRILRLVEEAEREGRARPEDLREAYLRLDALRRERWTKDHLERFPIAEALQNPKRHGLVILGDPGSGKTTLLNFLALVFARGPQAVAEHLQITGSEADRLPILRRLPLMTKCSTTTRN